MSTSDPGASPEEISIVESVVGSSVKALRESAGTAAAALYRPHPDGSYVLWVTDGQVRAPGRVWWEGAQGWLWADDGRHLVSPMGEGEQRVGLAVVGPWDEEDVGGELLERIDDATEEAERNIELATQEERRRAERQRDAIQSVVASVIPSTTEGLKGLLERAIEEERNAGQVAVETGSLVVHGGPSARGPALAILERALERVLAGGDPFEYSHYVIEAMAEAWDARAEHTRGHSDRVTRLSAETARELAWDEEAVGTVETAGRLHDVGAGFCGREALTKARLDHTEREAIRRHAELGAIILERADYPPDVVTAVRGHHERWDGAGYPDGLRGEDIPAAARVIALVEVYDAMTSARPWREPLSAETAMERLAEGSGTQFDPQVVAAFPAARWRLSPDGQQALAMYRDRPPGT